MCVLHQPSVFWDFKILHSPSQLVSRSIYLPTNLGKKGFPPVKTVIIAWTSVSWAVFVSHRFGFPHKTLSRNSHHPSKSPGLMSVSDTTGVWSSCIMFCLVTSPCLKDSLCLVLELKLQGQRSGGPVACRLDLPSHQPMVSAEPMSDWHQRILYPTSEQQQSLFSHPQASQHHVLWPQPARWYAKLWAQTVPALAEHNFYEWEHLGRKIHLSKAKDGSQSTQESQK